MKKYKKVKPELVIQAGHTGGIFYISYSPDGKEILSADSNAIKLWQRATGKLIRTINDPTSNISSVCFSPDGKEVLAASLDNIIRLYNKDNGALIRSFQGHEDFISSVCFSPDGIEILSGSYDQTIKCRNKNTGKLIHTLKGHFKPVSCVCVSPDGEEILSGSGLLCISFNEKEIRYVPDYHKIKLWNKKKGKLIRTFKIHSMGVKDVCFSPDGENILSILYNGSIIIWNKNSGKRLNIPVKTIAFSAGYSPNGEDIIIASTGKLTLWNIRRLEKIKEYEGNPREREYRACFSPDGKEILSADRNETLKLWEKSTGKLKTIIKGNIIEVSSVRFSLDGSKIYSGIENGIVELKWLNEFSYKRFSSFENNAVRLRDLLFSPDEKEAVYLGYSDNSINLHNTANGALIRNFEGNTKEVRSVCFSSDGKEILSVSTDNKIKLWNKLNGTVFTTIEAPTFVSVACFSPDGHEILSGSSDAIRLWDKTNGTLIRTFKGHTADVHSVCFSQDASLFLSGSSDSTIKLWDKASGKVIKTIKGHNGGVSFVCLAPGGKEFLSLGSFDNKIKLWDLFSRKLLRVFEGHHSVVRSVSFSPNGQKVLSLGWDNIIKIWETNSGKEIIEIIFLDDNDWAVRTQDGLFDASSGAMSKMHFVAGLEIIDFEQLRHRYWDPGLLAKVMGYNPDPVREVPAIDYVTLYPKITLSIENTFLDIVLQNQGGGIGPVVVKINGTVKLPDARSSEMDSDKENLSIKLDLVKFIDIRDRGETFKVEVVAFNAEGYLSSRPETIEFTPFLDETKEETLWKIIPKGVKIPVSYFGLLSKHEEPVFYGLFIGISKYRDPKLNLSFSAHDAHAIGDAIERGARNLFKKINVRTYPADKDRPLHKEDIKKAFDALGSSAIKDVVTIYLSGHGVNYGGQDGDYYYLTSSCTSLDTEYFSDPMIRENYTISSRELSDWIRGIKAGKKILILDTCASEKAAEQILSRHVPSSQIRALERLQDNSGFHILAGCAANAVSYESARYGQGLLTYSLLKGMRGDSLRIDGENAFVDVRILFEYAEGMVQGLASEWGLFQKPHYFAAKEQRSFDIGLIRDEDKFAIPLEEPKPVIMPSSIQNADLLGKETGLAGTIDAGLREFLLDDRTVIYTQSTRYPNAYQLKGRYSETEKRIKLEYTMLFNGQPIVPATDFVIINSDTRNFILKIICTTREHFKSIAK